MKTWIYIIIAAAVAYTIFLANGLGYESGKAQAQLKCEQAINQVEREQKQIIDDLRAKADDLEQARIDTTTEREVVYETIEKEVVKYVEVAGDDQCIADDDFMRIWRKANAGLQSQTGSG